MTNAEARLLRLQAQRAAARREIKRAELRNARRAEIAVRERDEARRQAALLAQRARVPPPTERVAALALHERSRVADVASKRAAPRQHPSAGRRRPLPLRQPRFKRASSTPTAPRAVPAKTVATKAHRSPSPRVEAMRKTRIPLRGIALPPREKSTPHSMAASRPARSVPRSTQFIQKAAVVRLPRQPRRQPMRAALPLPARAVPGQRGAPQAALRAKPVARRRAGKPRQAVALARAQTTHRSPEPLKSLKVRAIATRTPAAVPARSALPAKTVARPKAPPAREPAPGISWLITEGNLILNEDGTPVLLRGINVLGLDDALANGSGSPRDALGLTDAALDLLAVTWGANLVRLPVSVATLVAGTAVLEALDDLCATLSEAGLYTLLALNAPLASDRTAVPDDTVYAALGLVAARYRDAPGVLFELYASPLPQPEGWQDLANRLIGAVRIEHPAALVLVSGASGGSDVAGLPIRFATGNPVHNVIYTLRFESGQSPPASDPRFHLFARTYPLMASTWSNGADDMGRGAERAGQLFNRYGMGWAAAHWNAEPRLVKRTPQGSLIPTRFGLDILRALALPVRLAFAPAAAAFGIAPAIRCGI